MCFARNVSLGNFSIGRHIDHFGQCPICDRRIQDRHPAFLDVKIPLEPNGRCSEVANKNKNNNNVIQEAKAIMQGWVDATLNAKGFMDTPTTPNTMWCCNCEAQVPKKQFSKRELKSGFPSCRIHAED
ncbi:hypothetical protein MBANPS3_011513 [Mucor bainieri]